VTRKRLLSGGNPLAQSVAAIVIGLTLGPEIDVIVYLTTKHFGLKNFGTILWRIAHSLIDWHGVRPFERRGCV